MIALIFLLFITPSIARDLDGRYAQSQLHQWFQQLYNKNGVNCCAEADGVRVRDAEWTTGPNGYRVRLCDGQRKCDWYDVPPEAVLDTKNRAGDAMVWRQWLDGKPKILCFLAGAGA